ncbi:EF-hand domain-containing protein [Sulfurimonas lithotrophica]|uniref:EF-hand domain-containing protein n=2 Tax=Sulfurimonas lithotrophica TaxID=2590022 RepID=A0A5P8P4M0_9BACT|nr:EF-hand domain-containing protein [Sulfurimonas lithotrophica]
MLSIPVLAVEAMNPSMRGPVPFSSYDTNGDGLVTKKEFNELREKRMKMREESGRPMRNAANAPDFSFFDANGDGKLTQKELTDGQNARMQERRSNKMGGGMMGKGPR